MNVYNSTELALRKWPALRIQIQVKRDYSLDAREAAQKLRIPIEANDDSAEPCQIVGVSSGTATHIQDRCTVCRFYDPCAESAHQVTGFRRLVGAACSLRFSAPIHDDFSSWCSYRNHGLSIF
jgi:hypothetical protein